MISYVHEYVIHGLEVCYITIYIGTAHVPIATHKYTQYCLILSTGCASVAVTRSIAEDLLQPHHTVKGLNGAYGCITETRQ